ncbi:MAG: ATP-binding protein [Desulfovibrio sp.]
MNYRSLEFRTIATFCVLLVVLLGIYIFGLFGAVRVTEDNMINAILKNEAQAYYERYKKDVHAELPRMQGMMAYEGQHNLPSEFFTTLVGREDGFYEMDGTGGVAEPHGYHVYISTYPDSVEKLYLVFLAKSLLEKEHCVFNVGAIHFVVLAVTVVFGVLLFVVVGIVIFKPMRRLTEKVQESGPSAIDKEFVESMRDDEIGMLAKNINHSFERIQHFAEREREFSRDASHELRTPLSIIKNAVDLLRSASKPNPKVDAVFGRIQRSVENMEQTISTFLWLSREENVGFEYAPCELNYLIGNIVEDLRYLLMQKNVTIHLEFAAKCYVKAPEQVLNIILTNLLTNAVNYAGGGEVTVVTTRQMLMVQDSGAGIASDIVETATEPHVRGKGSCGFGLGLSIVQRLCNKFNWSLTLGNSRHCGAVVTVNFNTAAFPKENLSSRK